VNRTAEAHSTAVFKQWGREGVDPHNVLVVATLGGEVVCPAFPITCTAARRLAIDGMLQFYRKGCPNHAALTGTILTYYDETSKRNYT
jgi:hypothetical protein